MSKNQCNARTRRFVKGMGAADPTWAAFLLALAGPAVSLAQIPPEPIPPSFKAPAVYCTISGSCNPTGSSHPLGMVIAELLGGDAYPEVAVVNAAHQSVTVFKNRGAGNWSDPSSGLEYASGSPFSLSGVPYDVDAADMDGDQDLDLVVTLQAPGRLAILTNNGTTFSTPTYLSLTGTAPFPRGLELYDFDQNGKMDIAVASRYLTAQHHPRLEILYQETNGTWDTGHVYDPSPQTYIGGGTEIVKARVELNNPTGRRDLVMALDGHNQVYRLVSTGGRNWDAEIKPGVASLGMDIGRFGTDQARDIVLSYDGISNDPNESVELFQGDGHGDFSYLASYELPPAIDPYGVAVGKVNTTDTQDDIVVAVQHGDPCPGSHGGIVILLGRANATFVEPAMRICVDPDDPPKPCFVKIADLNQDNKNDIVTSNADSGNQRLNQRSDTVT